MPLVTGGSDHEPSGRRTQAQFLARWEVSEVAGPVVAIDVVRAFTTAAYAFGAGARSILLVDSVAEALALKADEPRRLVVGEDHGRRPAGFDLPNSPVAVAAADLDGRTLVQRTSAGTRGVVAARSATRLWAASLVCASATATAVESSGLGAPSYVITGRFPDDPAHSGEDDLFAAQLIERARRRQPLDAEATARQVAATEEATRTLALGDGHVHPDDILYATRVDIFDFAMEVRRVDGLLALEPVRSSQEP